LQATAAGIQLTVRQSADRLCYVANGDADAPVIRARLGAELDITLRNEISDPSAIDAVSGPGKLTSANDPVPDSTDFYQVIPGMKHPASGATNLHVHGFAVPPVRPQDDVLTTCTDPASGPVGCGQRSFTYRYRIPRDMPEGLYWYHPHIHGEVQAQMLMGLSGALLVDGPQADARRAAGIEERLLIIRQTQDLDASKPQAAAMIAAPMQHEQDSQHSGSSSSTKHAADAVDTAHELLCTRNAGIDAISLNGTPVPVGDAPESAIAHWQIPAGSRQFWRVLNAATDAFLDLVVVDEHGVGLPIEVAAIDGAPLTDDSGASVSSGPTLQSQLIPPSGRLEFWISAPPSGIKMYLVTHAVDTGCAGDRLPERKLAVIEASAANAASAENVAKSANSASIEAALATPGRSAMRVSPRQPNLFSGLLARHTDRRRVIAMAEYPRPGADDQIDFYIAERRPGQVLKPYHMGDPPAITVRAGTTEEWVVENWTNELHAFHIHQLHFRLLEVDGTPVQDAALLDVVNVPYATPTGYHSKEGPVHPGRVRIKLTFPPQLAGDIPFHCHLVDHEDNGMMAVLRVTPVASRK
jgi:FtsP/CotA-like multicopper oxidase with cupredoxin domain